MSGVVGDGGTVTISRELFDRLASEAICRAGDVGSVFGAEDAVAVCCLPEFRRLMTPRLMRQHPAWLRKFLRKSPVSFGGRDG